jgi:hypothetical protein
MGKRARIVAVLLITMTSMECWALRPENLSTASKWDTHHIISGHFRNPVHQVCDREINNLIKTQFPQGLPFSAVRNELRTKTLADFNQIPCGYHGPETTCWQTTTSYFEESIETIVVVRGESDLKTVYPLSNGLLCSLLN